MPAAEITTRECMKLKHELQGRCVVPFHSYEAVDRAASKFDIVNLARSLQVPIPCTHYLHKPADLENTYRFCAETGYPIVVKASRSRVELAGDNVHATTQYANNAPELHSVIQSFDPAQFPLLIQERVQGDGVGIFACFDRGRAIAYFAHHRIREKPPSGGVSVLRESIAVDEELKSYSERLLQALQWHGVAMVEFKSDAKHGGFKLMEINGRFWGSLQLAIDAGVDFPLLLARIAMDEKVEPVSYYRLNVRTRWLWGDADSLLAVLFKSRRQLHLPDHFPGKKQYLKEFLRLRSSDLNFEVLKMNDPMPWFLETMQWLHLMR
jgi:predicted ATP-grasp superfamily ATP-dependent carboligase